MSNWNHRIWRCTSSCETFLTVKETYYNAKGEICGCTDDPLDFFAYNLDEMLVLLDRVQKATEAAVLDSSLILEDEGFVFAPWNDVYGDVEDE